MIPVTSQPTHFKFLKFLFIETSRQHPAEHSLSKCLVFRLPTTFLESSSRPESEKHEHFHTAGSQQFIEFSTEYPPTHWAVSGALSAFDSKASTRRTRSVTASIEIPCKSWLISSVFFPHRHPIGNFMKPPKTGCFCHRTALWDSKDSFFGMRSNRNPTKTGVLSSNPMGWLCFSLKNVIRPFRTIIHPFLHPSSLPLYPNRNTLF